MKIIYMFDQISQYIELAELPNIPSETIQFISNLKVHYDTYGFWSKKQITVIEGIWMTYLKDIDFNNIGSNYN